MQAMLADPVPLTLDFLEPKMKRLRQTVDDYYYAEFQVTAIRGFRLIVLTHTPTHTYTHRDKVIAMSALPYYAVGADNE